MLAPRGVLGVVVLVLWLLMEKLGEDHGQDVVFWLFCLLSSAVWQRWGSAVYTACQMGRGAGKGVAARSASN